MPSQTNIISLLTVAGKVLTVRHKALAGHALWAAPHRVDNHVRCARQVAVVDVELADVAELIHIAAVCACDDSAHAQTAGGCVVMVFVCCLLTSYQQTAPKLRQMSRC